LPQVVSKEKAKTKFTKSSSEELKVLMGQIEEMKELLDKLVPLPEQFKSLQIKVNNLTLHQKLESASPIQNAAK